MKILNYFRSLLLILLNGCGEADKPQTYVFDADDMETNIKKYIVSNGPMDEIKCKMTSLLFLKEKLNAIK